VSLVYRILYTIGFTPWDSGEVQPELMALVEGAAALSPGRALDIGCGTGTQAIYLAQHGWTVTALDAVEKPLRRARLRSAAEDVDVQWIKGDVTRLGDLGLEPGFALLFDRGCFHGLNDAERAAYARGATALAAADATLLMMAFERNDVRIGPDGADPDEVARSFADGWEVVSDEADTGTGPAGPLKDVPRHWYRLKRR
jgi:cyclopropane fatty-acyl-phospholipid synthase-like methyltransferase